MRFRDIPQLTRCYVGRTDVHLNDLPHHLAWLNAPGYGLPIDWNPDFQRGHVWTAAQQIAYVEFTLRGGMQQPIYLNDNCMSINDTSKWMAVCVDGLQRITALSAFLENRLPAFGLLHAQYEGVPTATIPFYVNNLLTRAEVLQWYLEINDGGTPHTEAELRRVQSLLQECK